jgi:Holliday junction DNA helicase RuvA
MELKDKKISAPVSDGVPTKARASKIANDAAPLSLTEDAISALVNLGYGRSEAYMAVNSVMQKGDAADLGALITLSLKEIAA